MKTIKKILCWFQNFSLYKQSLKSDTPVLNNVCIWEESLLVLAILFLPLLFAFLISADAIKSLSSNTIRFLVIHIAVIYLITVMLNGVAPFKSYIVNVIAAGITPFIWLLSFSRVFSDLKNFGSVFNYTWAVLLFLFCYAVNFLFVCNLNLNKYILQVVKFIYPAFLFFLAIPAVVNLAYVELYGREVDDFVALTILQTNYAEAKSYLLTKFTIEQLYLIWMIAFLVFILLCLSISRLSLLKKENHRLTDKKSKRHKFCITIIVIALLGFLLYKHHFSIFPFEIYYSINNTDDGLLRKFTAFNKNIKNNESQIQVFDLKTTDQSGTIILVIGESASRDYMSAFNRKMAENTTPWEKQMRHRKDFVFFNNAYSNFTLTTLSLSLALTNSNQYNNVSLDKAVSIINVAKKAGFNTYYYSMQQKGTLYDAVIAVIANQADHVEFVCEDYYGYDEQILQVLKNISPAKKNFVILHLRGSHFVYSERYPLQFAKENSRLFSEPYKEYKLSLLYTDQILNNIFQYAKNHLNLQSMIYFSDHGEDMKYTHLPNYFTFSMVHIPLWIYLSQDYYGAHPEILANLKRNKEAVFTNDIMFDTIHGLLQCKSNYYNSEFDLSNEAYELSLSTAKTMHGKKNIIEDPVWKRDK